MLKMECDAKEVREKDGNEYDTRNFGLIRESQLEPFRYIYS